MARSELNVHPVRYAVDAFSSDLKAVCGAFNIEPQLTDRDHLQAHLSVKKTGGLDLARVGVNADSVHRAKRDIRYDPGEHFFLILQQKGRAHMTQGEASTRAECGDMFVVDATKPCTFRYDGRYSLQLSVHLPRDEMLHRFGKRICGGIDIDGNDPLAIAMKAVLAKLLTAPESSAQLHTVEAFYSVFGALLTERALGNGHTPDANRQLVARALTLIGEHYQNPDFKTQGLADNLGVSLRRLQRAFQIIDETPHERLQRYRVLAVNEAILSQPSRTITELAYSAGFRDLSTFYRSYRKYFGRPPGQVDAECKEN